MGKVSLKQLLKSKLFIVAAVMTVVIVGGIVGVTLLLLDKSDEAVAIQPNIIRTPIDEVPTEPIVVSVSTSTSTTQDNQPDLPSGWTWSMFTACDTGIPTPPREAPYIEDGSNGAYWQYSPVEAAPKKTAAWVVFKNDYGGDWFPFVSVSCEPNEENKTMETLLAEFEAQSRPEREGVPAMVGKYYQTQKWGKPVIYAERLGFSTQYVYVFIENGQIFEAEIAGSNTTSPEVAGEYLQPYQAQKVILDTLWFNASAASN